MVEPEEFEARRAFLASLSEELYVAKIGGRYLIHGRADNPQYPHFIYGCDLHTKEPICHDLGFYIPKLVSVTEAGRDKPIDPTAILGQHSKMCLVGETDAQYSARQRYIGREMGEGERLVERLQDNREDPLTGIKKPMDTFERTIELLMFAFDN